MTEPAPTSTTSQQSGPIARLLVALFALLVLAGGFIFWRMSHQSGPAHAVAEQFLRAMSAGDAKAAEALCTSDVDFPGLERMATKQRQMWGAIQKISLISRASTFHGKPCDDIAGTLAYERLTEEAVQITAVQQPDGTYRIAAYQFESR